MFISCLCPSATLPQQHGTLRLNQCKMLWIGVKAQFRLAAIAGIHVGLTRSLCTYKHGLILGFFSGDSHLDSADRGMFYLLDNPKMISACSCYGGFYRPFSIIVPHVSSPKRRYYLWSGPTSCIAFPSWCLFPPQCTGQQFRGSVSFPNTHWQTSCQSFNRRTTPLSTHPRLPIKNPFHTESLLGERVIVERMDIKISSDKNCGFEQWLFSHNLTLGPIKTLDLVSIVLGLPVKTKPLLG